MKSKIKGILLVALAFSFTMVACGNQGKIIIQAKPRQTAIKLKII